MRIGWIEPTVVNRRICSIGMCVYYVLYNYDVGVIEEEKAQLSQRDRATRCDS